MTNEDRGTFLELLEAILNNDSQWNQIKGNIGIFRNRGMFHVLSVPNDIESGFHIATTFHVKPLLRLLQAEQEFLLVGFVKNSAHLYFGCEKSFRFVDSVLFPETFGSEGGSTDLLTFKEARETRLRQEEAFKRLNSWIDQLTGQSRPRLFVAGEKAVVANFNRLSRYRNSVKTPVAHNFGAHNLITIAVKIQKTLREDASRVVERSILKFKVAEEVDQTMNNLFQISKAISEKKIRKLIITEDQNIYGKIEPKSGRVAVHLFDLDHEDDDVLDDLAQILLSQGGEVVVAKSSEIPGGQPILAIRNDSLKELSKSADV